MIEVEKRGFLSKEKYEELLSFLKENAKDLGKDDKDVVYYIYPEKLLKVVNNISKQNAKISLKTSKIGKGSAFPETEVFFNSKDFEDLRYVCDNITKPEKVMSGIQKRHNFEYKQCEIAIKWSKEWKYHFEIEKLIHNLDSLKQAEEDLEKIASELGVEILSEEYLKKWTKEIETINNTNYRDSLLGKNKPKNQNNDLESINWIKNHNPFLNVEYSKKHKEVLEKILTIKPWDQFHDDFYLNKDVLNGIHGRNHAKRVVVNFLYIILKKNINLTELQPLILSALFHDASRENDNADEGHGERSANLFKDYVIKNAIKNFEPYYFAIFFHEKNYDLIEKESNYLENRVICDLLKVGDALDRYRFPLDKWWINTDFLKIDLSEEDKKFAFDLCVLTEERQLKEGSVSYEEEIKKLI